MRNRNPAKFTGLALVLLAGSTLAFLPSVATPSGAATASAGEYLAMGDSFSSGEGLESTATTYLTPSNNDGCHRSTKAYPDLVAQSLGLDLSTFNTYTPSSTPPTNAFVACSGATTSEVLNGSKTEPSQLPPNSSSTTKYITLTAGGDDLGFSGVFKDCMDLTVNFGKATVFTESSVLELGSTATCTNDLKNDQALLPTSTSDKSSPLEQRLASLYNAALKNVPNADLMVLNYPQIFTKSESGFCPLTGGVGITGGTTAYLSLSPTNVFYFNIIQTELDQAISDAASSVQAQGLNVQLVDVNSPTQSLAFPCNAEWNAFSDINGVNFALGSSFSSFIRNCFSAWGIPDCSSSAWSAFAQNIVSTQSFHPTQQGQATMASAVKTALAKSQLPKTTVLVPASGANVSGTTILDAAASNATSVEFRLIGGIYGFSGPVMCTATPTLYGWLCNWNTTTVPNGSYIVVSEAFNSVGSAFSTGVTITTGALSVSNTELANFSINEPYMAQLTASGGVGSITWSLSGGSLPAGITLTPDGAISGVPTSSAPATFTVEATDSKNDVATAQFKIVNVPVANPVLQSFTASATGPTVTFDLTVTDSNSVGLWDGFINFVCDDPSSGARTGTVGFVWFANPAAGAPFGSDTSSLIYGTLNDGLYDPSAGGGGVDGVWGNCQPFEVGMGDQDGGASVYGSGDATNPDFPFAASFSLPQISTG